MVYLIGRHNVFNQESLDELKTIVSHIAAAAEIIKASRYPFELGLKVTVNEEKVGPHLSKEARDALGNLPLKTFLLYNPVSLGAGTSYQQILFNPTFSAKGDKTVVCADFDQFIINEPEGLESILDLVGEVKRKNALYGIGSRDVPVVMAKHKRNSDLRIIHELFHSLAAGKENLVVPKKTEGCTPAYAALGESSSGLYVMNQNHPAYPKLLQLVSAATQSANMQGFATDYFASIVATQLAPLGSGYVRAKENIFYQEKTEEEEKQGVIGLISSQTTELGKTEVRGVLEWTLKEDKDIAKIMEFYDESDVREVQQLMLRAL